MGNGRFTTGGDAVAVQSNGRIVLAADSGLAAFGDSGKPDEEFAAASRAALSGFAPHLVDDLAVDGSDRILVMLDVDPGAAGMALVRLEPSGRLDTTFGVNGSIGVGDGFSGAVAVDPAGGLAVTSAGELFRFLPGGSPDTGFSADGVFESEKDFYGVDVDGEGRVLAIRYDSLVRLTPAGDLDASFGVAGEIRFPATSYGGPSDLALGPAGDLYVLAHGCQPDFILRCTTYVLRLDDSGNTVWRSGLQRSSEGLPSFELGSLVVDAEGRAVVLNLSDSVGMKVSRLTPEGNADPSFGVSEGTSASFPGGCQMAARAVALDARGQPVVAAAGCSSQPGAIGRSAVRLSVADGVRNLDADPFDDERDRCDKYPSSQHRGCGVIDRTLRIKSIKGRKVIGAIQDPDYFPPLQGEPRIPPPPLHTWTACQVDSPVQLVRRRPGKDRILAREITYRSRWDFRLPKGPLGRLTVRAPSRVLEGSEKFGGVALCGAASIRLKSGD